MAIKFKNLASASCGYQCDSRSCSIPSGFSEGDLLIAVVDVSNDSNITISTPSGWSGLQSGWSFNDSWGWKSQVAYRIAQAGDTSWTWTTSSVVSYIYVNILRYTGQSLTSPIHASGKIIWDGGENPRAPSVGYTDLNYGSLAFQSVGSNWSVLGTPPAQLDIRYSTSKYSGGDKSISGSGSTGLAIWPTTWTVAVGLTVVINAKESFIPTINIF